MFENKFVFASYFNHKPDPQRQITWDDDYTRVLLLIASVITQDVGIKIFHNCFKNPPELKNCEWIYVEPDQRFTPNVVRWMIYHEYLKNNQNFIRGVFMVDSTDVQMLKNPFRNSLEHDVIYCGSEERKVENDWMRYTQEQFLNISDYRKIIEANANKRLVNCGICGGRTDIILKFLEKLVEYHQKHSMYLDSSSDMSVFNYTVWKHFSKNLRVGEEINTRFKGNEFNNVAWWKHK